MSSKIIELYNIHILIAGKYLATYQWLLFITIVVKKIQFQSSCQENIVSIQPKLGAKRNYRKMSLVMND